MVGIADADAVVGWAACWHSALCWRGGEGANRRASPCVSLSVCLAVFVSLSVCLSVCLSVSDWTVDMSALSLVGGKRRSACSAAEQCSGSQSVLSGTAPALRSRQPCCGRSLAARRDIPAHAVCPPSAESYTRGRAAGWRGAEPTATAAAGRSRWGATELAGRQPPPPPPRLLSPPHRRAVSHCCTAAVPRGVTSPRCAPSAEI